MRVLIVNTSEKIGGAAIAANRLMEALKNNGVKAKMLVRDKQTNHISVSALPPSRLHHLKFIWERFVIWKANHFKKHNLFQVDIANVGTDITTLPEFKEADIIHIHWINQGYLSLKDIQKIVKSGKPIVWTLHDMWPFTGICHYNGGCEKFHQLCQNCPMLIDGGSRNDLSTKVFRKKEKLYQSAHITFVGCSKWIAEEARKSGLLTGQKIVSIPNAINSNVFHPGQKKEARLKLHLPEDRILILFSCMKITDKKKGVDYMIEACNILKQKSPELAEKLGIVVVGKEAYSMRSLFPLPVFPIEYISDEKQMALVYNAVDTFVIPSLQDNLPNTLAEAMSCGTPCVGFRTGGIPEMIDHKENGYLANIKDAEDLAAGITYVLQEADHEALGMSAVRKANATYGESNVAMKYINIYNQITNRAQA